MLYYFYTYFFIFYIFFGFKLLYWMVTLLYVVSVERIAPKYIYKYFNMC